VYIIYIGYACSNSVNVQEQKMLGDRHSESVKKKKNLRGMRPVERSTAGDSEDTDVVGTSRGSWVLLRLASQTLVRILTQDTSLSMRS
jgi:hypothetical protein